MNAPLTAREAIIAELFGDAAELLDRMEKLRPELKAEADRFQVNTKAVIEQAQASAVNHIVRRTNEEAKRAVAEQTAMIAEAARSAFNQEIGTHMRLIIQQQLQESFRQRRPAWHAWAVHAAISLLSAVIAVAATVLVLVR